MLESKTLHIAVERSPQEVYEFVSNPENLPKWAKTFCLSIKKSKGEWAIETPQGPANIRIAGKNQFGILDHYVIPAPGVEVFVPMRVVPNASGSEVIFTLFKQPGMTDENYANDAGMVEADLKSLKNTLESGK